MLFIDFEVFKHDWLCVIADTDTKTFTEVVNDRDKLKEIYEEESNNIWIGYNIRSYDSYILKAILLGIDPHLVNDFIIVQRKKGWEYTNAFRQIKLYTFDIMTSFHGLKQLEGFMGNDIRESSVDFNIDRRLTPSEIKEVLSYCRHDVEQTIEVFLNRSEEFESQMGLITAFKLPLENISKTKPQISSYILGAMRTSRDDEFDISIPDTLVLSDKYKPIADWYLCEENQDYDKTQEVMVAGVPHIFAWGGLHGARDNYIKSGNFLNIDVASFYPALMIEYDYLSRNVTEPAKFREIRDTRIEYKKAKDKQANSLKIVLNSTYGAMKDKYNALYDPRQANNVCIGGQLLLLDLIEKLESSGLGKLIQTNTDGLIYKYESDDEFNSIKSVCKEWEKRTRMDLEYDLYSMIAQKDVNNYILVAPDGDYVSKGAYVKKLNKLDNDLPIVNKAVVDYFIKNIPPEETIRNCTELVEFQQISKVSNLYLYAVNGFGEILKEKTLRVFASRSKSDSGLFKVKAATNKPEKIPYTPKQCRIINSSVLGVDRTDMRWLDVNWYVDTAQKRINDFKGVG